MGLPVDTVMAPPMPANEEDKVKVKKSQLEKAIRALVQLVLKRTANANPLFGANSETMNLIFTLSEVPDKRRIKPMLIKLPHPLYDDKSEVCFLAKDPQKQYKELLLQKHAVPGITKVIGLDKLKRNYKTAEAKRALADAFDLFLCDSRIMAMMPKLLGTTFYEKNLKRPIPVRLKLQDPAPNLHNAIAGTTLRVPSGPCLGVRFGRCSMGEEHLLANAAAVISFVTKYLVKNPVQTISVQATDSPALPVWRRAPSPGELVNLKKYHSDAVSSSASDTGISGASDTESAQASELPSDAGETLSTRDTVSDVDTMSELETNSELDSEAGDVDQKVAVKTALPLLQGLKAKKRKFATVTASSPDTSSQAKLSESDTMKPPPKKAKRSKPAEAVAA